MKSALIFQSQSLKLPNIWCKIFDKKLEKPKLPGGRTRKFSFFLPNCIFYLILSQTDAFLQRFSLSSLVCANYATITTSLGLTKTARKCALIMKIPQGDLHRLFAPPVLFPTSRPSKKQNHQNFRKFWNLFRKFQRTIRRKRSLFFLLSPPILICFLLLFLLSLFPMQELMGNKTQKREERISKPSLPMPPLKLFSFLLKRVGLD